MKKTWLSLAVLLSILPSVSSCSKDKENSFFFPGWSDKDYKAKFYYQDDYFLGDSTEYDPSLSTCSLAFAMASFPSNENGPDNSYEFRYKNGQDFLLKSGFQDIDVNQYYKEKPTTDSLGVIFGHKEIDGKTMVACGIRGASYEREWASNITIGDGKDIKQAQGFYEASTIFLNSLKEYLTKYNIKGSIKLWSVGYSRAAATNNIASGRIDQMMKKDGSLFSGLVSIEKEDLFSYCFEPPQGASYTEKISPRDEMYSNIHNIVNDNDMVTKVAMSAFSFTRYGVDHYLPDSIRDHNYQSHIEKVLDFYTDIEDYLELGDYVISEFDPAQSCSIETIRDETKINWAPGLFLSDFITDFSLIGVNDLSNYVSNIQSGLRDIMEALYKSGSLSSSMMTLGMTLLTNLLSDVRHDQLLNDLIHDTESGLNELFSVLQKSLSQLQVEINTVDLKKSLTSLLNAILKTCKAHPDYLLTLFDLKNIKALGSAHYPELCLSHLMAQDPNYTAMPFTYDATGDMFYLSADLKETENVKIEIKDRLGRILAGFKDDMLFQDTKFSCCIEGEKLRIYFPSYLEYRIETENQMFDLELVTPDKRYPTKVYRSKKDDSVRIKNKEIVKSDKAIQI